MTSQYNRARPIGSVAYVRQQLINLMFPYGYPTETAPAAFLSALSGAWTVGAFTSLTYISATSFSVANDQTSTGTGALAVGQRIKTTNTAGTVYSYITASTYSSPTTTVTVSNWGTGVLDSGLSAVAYGPLSALSGLITLNRGGNKVMLPGYGNAFQLRYNAPVVTPTGSPDPHVLIWCHGHDNTANSVAYGASSNGSGAEYSVTGANHCERMQQYGVPGSTTLPSYATTPLLSGIGVLEVSMFGEYLNEFFNLYTDYTTQHTPIISDLGVEGVGTFLWPIIVAINSVVAAGMIPIIGGHSGGGWTTLLTAAIDTRPKMSFVHCGYDVKFPMTVTNPNYTSATGDGEQIQPDVYNVAYAHELAVMACDNNRSAWHCWNISSGAGADTVFPATAADIAGLSQGGLPALAAQYGGSLTYMGFDGNDDPVTNFGAGTDNAVFNAGLANAVYLSAQNGSTQLGAFTYTGTGHHLMNQWLNVITQQILANRGT